MKTKIYLAKSNRANPDEVMRVRSLLAKYPEHIEIVEYTGGKYSHKDLKGCDLLVIVPDLSEYEDTCDNSISIGKGLHEQIEAFQSINPNNCDIIVIIEATENWITTAGFEDLDFADCDDYVNYSEMIIDTDTVSEDLDDLLKHRLDCDTVMATKGSSSEMFYILIGK